MSARHIDELRLGIEGWRHKWQSTCALRRSGALPFKQLLVCDICRYGSRQVVHGEVREGGDMSGEDGGARQWCCEVLHDCCGTVRLPAMQLAMLISQKAENCALRHWCSSGTYTASRHGTLGVLVVQRYSRGFTSP